MHMMIRNFISILATIVSINAVNIGDATHFNSASNYTDAKGVMSPLPNEKLGEPIYLDGPCSDVKIIEWRETKGVADSEMNEASINVLKNVCKLTVNNFESFIKTKDNYTLIGDVDDFRANICLMPLNSSPRNLNDIEFRFFNRYVKDTVWGYHQRATNNIYIRNDVFDGNMPRHYFVVVFAHELFHSLSYKYSIYDQHTGNKELVEEEMARQYTQYLGLGR